LCVRDPTAIQRLKADDPMASIPTMSTKRGGRKLMVTPDGAKWAPRPRVDNAMVKASARAFRWRKLLDTGVHASLENLARAKGVTPSYVSRVVRLTLLAPEIVEAILVGCSRRSCSWTICLRGFRWSGRHRPGSCNRHVLTTAEITERGPKAA
jgi:hypothetical protein